MAITYPLTFPAYGIASIKISQKTVVGQSISPFTLKRQVQVYSGQQWAAEISFPNYKRDKAAAIQAFVFALNGREGSFLLGDPDFATPQGSWGGTPLVNGGSQTGSTLNIDGLPNSITGIAKAGDYIQLGTGANARLHRILQDANSNGSGQVALTIWPRLRASPADNLAIITTNTVGVFALDANTQSFNIDSESTHSIAITASEVV